VEIIQFLRGFPTYLRFVASLLVIATAHAFIKFIFPPLADLTVFLLLFVCMFFWWKVGPPSQNGPLSQRLRNFWRNVQTGPNQPGQQGQPSQPWPGQPNQPWSGQPNQPWSGQPNQPWSGQPNQPWSGQPNQPWLGQPSQPWSGQPNQPGQQGQPSQPWTGQPSQSGQSHQPAQPDADE
jgi:hypothetical protein